MDLLEAILRSSGFEEYNNVFKNSGIDSFTLKILNDQDLKLIGIEDEERRQQLLNVINNLQIPSEKKNSLVVDKSYTLLVLHQMSFHLQKQMANLTYVLKREDVDICNIKLTPSLLSLQNVLISLQDRIEIFEQQVLGVKKRKERKKYIVIPSLILITATVAACSQYLLLKK